MKISERRWNKPHADHQTAWAHLFSREKIPQAMLPAGTIPKRSLQ
jgi:hypothetical protein